MADVAFYVGGLIGAIIWPSLVRLILRGLTFWWKGDQVLRTVAIAAVMVALMTWAILTPRGEHKAFLLGSNWLVIGLWTWFDLRLKSKPQEPVTLTLE